MRRLDWKLINWIKKFEPITDYVVELGNLFRDESGSLIGGEQTRNFNLDLNNSLDNHIFHV